MRIVKLNDYQNGRLLHTMMNKCQLFLKAVFLTLFVLMISVQTGYSEDRDINFAVDQIKIITTDGTRLDFTVEVALTKKQRQQGLMHRESMGQDKGMLFIFPQTGHFGLWMKNTKIPLDMLFIDELGVVNYIYPMAEPLSTKTIKSKEPVRAVLEINGGLSEKLGITPGSRIIYPGFAQNVDSFSTIQHPWVWPVTYLWLLMRRP